MAYKNDRTKNRRRYKSRYRTPHNYKTKKSVSNSRIAVTVSVITFVVLACLIVVFVFGDTIYNFLDNGLKHISATETQKITQPATQMTVATEKPTEPKVEQSDKFIALCKSAGLDVDKLDSKQIIFVKCNDTTCSLSTYEEKDKKFKAVLEDVEGNISQEGAVEDMGPEDRYTPLGNFNIEFAFGTSPNPGTRLSYEEVTEGSFWITDPASLNYNKMIGDDATLFDFDSAITLSEYSVSYEHAIVFSYNRDPVDKEKGCAKFLHVGPSTEYGGIGIDRDMLIEVLNWLDPDKSPIICIYK